jgi:hypothetical protein
MRYLRYVAYLFHGMLTVPYACMMWSGWVGRSESDSLDLSEGEV